MATTTVQNNSNRTSANTNAKIFAALKTPRSGYEFASLLGAADLTNLAQFNPFETGYGLLIMLEAPTFIKMAAAKNSDVDNLLTIFTKTIENEFKSFSGIGGYNTETGEIGNGIDSINMITKTSIESSGTFSIPYTEKVGTPLSKFLELVVSGIKDPKSSYKTYLGELENDYSLEPGFEKEVFTFLYIVTDNTGRELERAMLFTGCQPQSVPRSELFDSTKGDVGNVEISIEFSYYAVESNEINVLAKDYLDWLNNDNNPDKIIKNMYERKHVGVDVLRNAVGSIGS